VARAAAAETCPAPDDAPALATVDSEERLTYLARAFDREIRDVDVWSWTWGTTYFAAAAVQASILPLSHDYGLHVDLTVGAASAAFGSLSLFVLPLQITLPLRKARDDWGDRDRCRLIALAEASLVGAEKKQELSTGWIPHAGNVAFNAGLAVILGWGFDRWKSAAISAGVGLAVGETNAFTQPHHLSTVLAKYRSGHLEDTGTSVDWSIAPLVGPSVGGVTLQGTF
jgi:hypothetical protein